MILTLDLGTTVTKAALWEPDGLVALAEVARSTDSPAPGVVEQSSSSWWDSVVGACAALGASRPDGLRSVEAVGCTGARQSFGLFGPDGSPVGPGILWADARATEEAARLAGAGDHDPLAAGLAPDAASVRAKLAWVAAHRPGELARSAWILAPRDLVAWRLTGEVATDVTLASLTGCYDGDGVVVAAVGEPVARRLPPVVPSDRVTGTVTAAAADRLGLRAGAPVVIGAGDRQCEVLGSGATDSVPMVSWGTTANVSLPVGARPTAVPGGVVVSRSATGGWQLEGGLSAAGSLLAWLGRLTGRDPGELADLAAGRPPGARGVTAVPWLGGARAPWWRPGAGAGFTGLADAHDAGDLARAVVEAVARDVQRCLEAMAGRTPPGPAVTGLALGGGASAPAWVAALTGVTGLPARHRRSGRAASAGAALLAARGTGRAWELDRMDPVTGTHGPDPAAVAAYVGLRPSHDRVAASLVDLGRPCA